MAVVSFDMYYDADLNKGLPLKGIQENYGVGYRREFEVAALDWLYQFKGVKYKSSFSKLDQCKGKVSSIDVDVYSNYSFRYKTAFRISELDISPKELIKIVKKGDQKATKELLKGDDRFIGLGEGTFTVNGYGGNDQFSFSNNSEDRAFGGPGNDYFRFSSAKDLIIDGGKGSDIFEITSSSGSINMKVLDFEKGKDKFLGGPGMDMKELGGDTVLTAGSSRYLLKGATGLTWKEQSVLFPDGETETRWVLN